MGGNQGLLPVPRHTEGTPVITVGFILGRMMCKMPDFFHLWSGELGYVQRGSVGISTDFSTACVGAARQHPPTLTATVVLLRNTPLGAVVPISASPPGAAFPSRAAPCSGVCSRARPAAAWSRHKEQPSKGSKQKEILCTLRCLPFLPRSPLLSPAPISVQCCWDLLLPWLAQDRARSHKCLRPLCPLRPPGRLPACCCRHAFNQPLKIIKGPTKPNMSQSVFKKCQLPHVSI